MSPYAGLDLSSHLQPVIGYGNAPVCRVGSPFSSLWGGRKFRFLKITLETYGDIDTLKLGAGLVDRPPKIRPGQGR